MKKYLYGLITFAALVLLPINAQAALNYTLTCDDSELQTNDIAKCSVKVYDVAASEALTSFKTTIKLEDMTLVKVTLGEGWSGTTTNGNINITHTGASGSFTLFTFEARLDEDAEECGVILLTRPTYNNTEAEEKEITIDVEQEKDVKNPDTASDYRVIVILMMGMLIAGIAFYIASQKKKVHKIQTY